MSFESSTSVLIGFHPIEEKACVSKNLTDFARGFHRLKENRYKIITLVREPSEVNSGWF